MNLLFNLPIKPVLFPISIPAFFHARTSSELETTTLGRDSYNLTSKSHLCWVLSETMILCSRGCHSSHYFISIFIGHSESMDRESWVDETGERRGLRVSEVVEVTLT